MKLREFFLFIPLISLLIGGNTSAEQTSGELDKALPSAPTEQAGKPPMLKIDYLLQRMSQNMEHAPTQMDSEAETSINREVNLSRSAGQMLKPVGFMQIGDQRVIFATEDGLRVLRLKEGSRIGVMKITQISENGVEYKVGGKTMFAPLAYMATEPPKAPQQTGQASQQQAPQNPSMQTPNR